MVHLTPPTPPWLPLRLPTRLSALKIALWYAAIGALWILCSGWVLHTLVQDGNQEALLETFKGWFYVSVTAFLLWLGLDRYFREIRRSSQQLQAAEAQLRTLGDNIPGGALYQLLMLPDGQSRFTHASAGFERILGMPPERILAEPLAFRELIVEEDRQRLFAEEQRCARTMAVFDLEFRQRSVGGEVKWIHARSTPRSLADGSIVWDGVVADITERKRAEAEINRQAATIKSLLDSIPDIIFFKDLNGVYLGCNPAFTEFVGRSREEIVGRSDHDLFPKEVAESFREYDRQMLETHSPCQNEEWVDYPDGRRRLLDTLKTPYWGPEGELLGVLGVSRDITERRGAQQALVRLHQQNQLILNSVAEGILGLDLQDRHIFINPAAARMLGYAAEDLLGLPAHETWHHTRADGSPYPADACLIRSALKGEAVEQISTELFWRKDGTSFPVEYSSRPILEQGKAVGVVVTFSDITERKRAEMELERMRVILSEGQRIAHVGSFEFVAATAETIWSEEEFRIYGLEPGPRSPSYAELVQKHLPREDAVLLDQTFRAALEAGSVYELEHRIVRPDGSVRDVYDLAQPYFDDRGKLVKYVGATLDITERKRAEADLRRNEQVLRLFVEHSPAAIAMFDREMRYIVASRRYLADFRLGEQNLTGRSHYEVFPEMDEARRAIHRRCLTGDTVKCEEDPLPRLDGTLDFVRYELRPWHETDGVIGGLIFFSEVITERKRAEQALRASEEQLRAMFELASVGIAQADPQNGRWLRVNQKLASITGYTAAELLQMRIPELTHPDDRRRDWELFQQVIRGESPAYRLEKRYVRKGGQIVWVNVNMTVIRDAGGQPWRTVAMIEDVTERKQAEEALHRSEERYRTLVQNANSAILRWRRDGTISFFNEYAERLFGYRAEEIIGQPVNLLVPERESSGEDLRQLVENILRHPDQHASVVNENVCRDGRRVWLAWTNKPLVDARGELIEILAVGSDITLRKQAELALRNQEATMRGILDATKESIWLFSPAGLVLMANETAAQRLGKTPADVVGRRFAELLPEELAQSRMAQLRKVLESGRSVTFEDQRAGSFFHHSFYPVVDAASRLSSVACFSQDITERKLAEDAVRASEVRRAVALDAAKAGTWEWELATGKNIWSEELWRLYGLTSHACEPSFDAWRQTVYPEDRTPVEQKLQEIVQQQAEINLEWRVNDPAGRERWLMSRGCPLRDEAGQVTRYLGVVMDISERKRAEKGIIESEKRYRTLFENMNAGFVLFELVQDQRGVPVDLIIVAANEKFAATSGVKLREAVGKRLTQVLPGIENDAANWIGTYGRIALTGQSQQFERGSELLGFHYSIAAFQAGPKLCGVTFVDITDGKRAEEALRQRNEELVRFVYTVSHDLKSPLVTIKTFLGYLEKDLPAGDPGRIETDMDFIRKAAEKMLRMLEELLELSRVGRKMNPPEDVSLQVLAREAQELVAGAIAERRVQVCVTDIPFMLHGDRQRLLEVFQNLLDNAVKFMGDQPSPQVDIGAEETERGVVFFVRDNGLGIDPRHQAKLFGLFEKLHPGTPGTGIGLALVKRIVEVHGGRIWAESAGPGQGTTFRFTLSGTKRS